MHDYCYHLANCPKFLEYFVPYLWKCFRGRPLCAVEHGEFGNYSQLFTIFFSNPDSRVIFILFCEGGPGSCAYTLCECDKALSYCLRRYLCPRKRAVCTSSPLRLLQNLFMDIWIIKLIILLLFSQFTKINWTVCYLIYSKC